MSTDAIRTRIDLSGQTLPAVVVLAAQERAEELSATVTGLLDDVVAERPLLLEEEDLLVFGLVALAAVRRTELCPALVRFLHGSEPPVDRLLGGDWPDEAGPLLLSLYDGDDAALRALLLDPDSSDDLRSLLFDVLARLVIDERADRAAFVDLLDRFDRENLAGACESAWAHWQDAVLAIGAAEFTERVRQGWETDRLYLWREVDEQDWLEQMHRRAEGHVPRTFAGDIEPIDDPMATFAWTERATDDRSETHLTRLELGWLDRVLLPVAAAGSVMSLEQADGFFTALLCGPRPVNFADCETPLWRGKPAGAGFDRPEIGEAVHRLFQKHFRSIAVRLAPNDELELFLDPEPADKRGALWASGFVDAMALNLEAWRRLGESKRGQDVMAHIIMLAPGMDDPEDEQLSPDARREVTLRLPEIIRGIRRFWRSGPSALPKLGNEEAPRGPKIGRNQPCPCGSGKKYKKCCGAEV